MAGTANPSIELAAGVSAQSNFNIKDGVWHHVVGIVDRSKSEALIYIDGILKNSMPFSASAYNDSNLIIGAWSKTASVENFNGTLDDVRIYNRALDANEVKSLYNVYWGD